MQAPSVSHQDPLPRKNATPWEASYQRFSQFQYEEAAGPREAFCKLWELCCQWLKPQIRSVDQILALFLMEKFLQILPADTEAGRIVLSEETRERVFALIENLQKDNGEPENKYQHLEPPGEEPPEQLLAECKTPEKTQKSSEYQDQWEMPGTSKKAQGPVNPGASAQARPDERPVFTEQLGLCSAHRQQRNIRVGSRSGRVAPEGPGNRAWPSCGPDLWARPSKEEGTHECASCGSSFSQAAYFDQERQQCRLCKREFMYKLGLKEHVKTQIVSRPYQCPYCGKSFRGQSHVIAHQVRHTDERPFVCQHCQKSYKHKSSLLRHLKTHKREDEHKEIQGSQGPMHNTH
ncbi:zinc finger protein 449-like [Mesocricetus auratus]|uniref:Zinc finger protein 449-like n=1 Tax=Mesocricetus auratus TaxID=10036 RepID=A0ABM2XA54_MESAU|nr:zinc finger protein 449-like [Mesocricetus auratus]